MISHLFLKFFDKSFFGRLANHLAIAALLAGCLPVKQPPLCSDSVSHPAQIDHLRSLWDPPLNISTKAALPWQIEATLGDRLARQLSWNEALWCYKRACLLAPDHDRAILQTLSYNTFLCHFLANRYSNAARYFESSALVDIEPSFPAYVDLLAALADCYNQLSLNDRDFVSRHEHVLKLLQKSEPSMAGKLLLRSAVQKGDSESLIAMADSNADLSHLRPLMKNYRLKLKSPQTAGLLNALLPGAGYWYVGLKQTALTSFALNALFGAAAWHFFHRGSTAAGLIALSFESGWYFGGIQGAQLAAMESNRRRFEPFGEKILREQNLGKPQLLTWGF